MLSKYLIIALVLSLLGAAGLAWALKKSYERNGALEAAAEINIAQVAKAKEAIEKLKEEREVLQTNVLQLGHANSVLEQDKARAIERYNKWRSTLDNRTLAKPKVTERAARMDIRRRQCELWKQTGGVGKCPI
jgi:hypothetical protein